MSGLSAFPESGNVTPPRKHAGLVRRSRHLTPHAGSMLDLSQDEGPEVAAPVGKRRARQRAEPAPAPVVTQEQLLSETTNLARVAIQVADVAESRANAVSDQLAEALDELEFWRRRYMQEFAQRLEISGKVCAANCCDPGERMLRRFVACTHYVCSAYVDSDQQRRIHAGGNVNAQANVATCPLCRRLSELRVEPALVPHVYSGQMVVGQHNYTVSQTLDLFMSRSCLDESPYAEQIMQAIDGTRPASADE